MIPNFDYRRGLNAHRAEYLQAIERVLDSGTLILGPEVEAFEMELQGRLRIDHCIGVGNGTDAIELALRALEISESEEVITTANGPVATAAAIRSVGAIPRFIDIEPTTLLIDSSKLDQCLTSKTRAIIVVHLYGLSAPLTPILEFARRNKIYVIEDCAQAFGTSYQGQSVGTWGDIGCFSFYPTKNVGGFGDGGMCCTSDRSLAIRMRSLAQYGFEGKERIAIREGFNSRLDELQAALLRVRLKYLDRAIERRSQVAQRYRSQLNGLNLHFPDPIPESRPSWHLFIARVPNRNAFRDRMLREGIQLGCHYPHPLHHMPAFQCFAGSLADLRQTEDACDQVLSLPMFPELSDPEVEQVIASCQRCSTIV